MQIIPQARNNLQKYEEHQFTFGGINHSAGARDGAIYDMENMALDDAPSLSVRKKRQLMPYDIEGKVYGIGSSDKLFWCADDEFGEAYFYYDGEKMFPVEKSKKTFAVINKYICIFPDKKYFSLWRDEVKGTYETLPLLEEAFGTEVLSDGDVYAVGTKEPYSLFQFNSTGKWKRLGSPSNSSVDADIEEYAYGRQSRWIYIMDSFGEMEAESSFTKKITAGPSGSRYKQLYMTESETGKGYDSFYEYQEPYITELNKFRVGDSVEITVKFYNDETDESRYQKYKGTFSEVSKVSSSLSSNELDKDCYRYTISGIDVPGTLTLSEDPDEGVFARYSAEIKRVVPDLEFAFCHENRIWGIDDDKICASKLGDPFNFQDFSLLADASWTVGVASSGPFTGGCVYNGYPTFFKEDSIIRVSGSYPSQYSTYETNDVAGVLKGSEKSLAIANGTLFYLSPEGVARYTGSYPSIVSDDLGKILSFGVAGAGADKYYLEAIDEEGEKAVYVLDTKINAWTKEEALFSAGFTDIGRELYALGDGGIYLIDSERELFDDSETIESFIEFAPIYDGHLTKKGLSKLHISLEASEGAKVSVYISYDGGDWIKAKEISSANRQNYNIPLTIRRCGYYRIKIEGKGNYIIYAIGKVRYFGSDM